MILVIMIIIIIIIMTMLIPMLLTIISIMRTNHNRVGPSAEARTPETKKTERRAICARRTCLKH